MEIIFDIVIFIFTSYNQELGSAYRKTNNNIVKKQFVDVTYANNA